MKTNNQHSRYQTFESDAARLQQMQPNANARLSDGTIVVCRTMQTLWSKSPCFKCYLRAVSGTGDVPACFHLCNARERSDHLSVFFQEGGVQK